MKDQRLSEELIALSQMFGRLDAFHTDPSSKRQQDKARAKEDRS